MPDNLTYGQVLTFPRQLLPILFWNDAHRLMVLYKTLMNLFYIYFVFLWNALLLLYVCCERMFMCQYSKLIWWNVLCNKISPANKAPWQYSHLLRKRKNFLQRFRMYEGCFFLSQNHTYCISNAFMFNTNKYSHDKFCIIYLWKFMLWNTKQIFFFSIISKTAGD